MQRGKSGKISFEDGKGGDAWEMVCQRHTGFLDDQSPAVAGLS